MFTSVIIIISALGLKHWMSPWDRETPTLGDKQLLWFSFLPMCLGSTFINVGMSAPLDETLFQVALVALGLVPLFAVCAYIHYKLTRTRKPSTPTTAPAPASYVDLVEDAAHKLPEPSADTNNVAGKILAVIAAGIVLFLIFGLLELI